MAKTVGLVPEWLLSGERRARGPPKCLPDSEACGCEWFRQRVHIALNVSCVRAVIACGYLATVSETSGSVGGTWLYFNK